jgi:hypothetical protein
VYQFARRKKVCGSLREEGTVVSRGTGELRTVGARAKTPLRRLEIRIVSRLVMREVDWWGVATRL